MDVEALVRPVVESVGLELWEVTYRRERGRMILRVDVDRDGGVDLDTIAQTSERLSRRLDLEGFAGTTPYSLEVGRLDRRASNSSSLARETRRATRRRQRSAKRICRCRSACFWK